MLVSNQYNEPARCITSKEKYIMDQFHKHLINVAIWSRALVIALKFNMPNTEDIYNRLLNEPKEVRDLIASSLSFGAPDLFESYLTEMIVDFRDLAEAVLANNPQRANDSLRKLYQTTDDMAEFFYNLNPTSSLEQWHTLLHDYVTMLYNEIYIILSDQYAQDIELFDKIINQSYLIADYISNTVLSFQRPEPASP